MSARIRVTKVCPTQPVASGGLLTFSGTVSNPGNVTLTNVVVVNDQPAPNTAVFTVPTLAPGATANFTGSYKVTVSNACTITDTLTATAQDRCGGNSIIERVTTACPLSTTPLIAVTKNCPDRPVAPGQLLVFTGAVTNTGNISLTNVVVVNSLPAPNTAVFGPITLAPGQGASFTGRYLAPTNNTCTVSDTLTATGNDGCTSRTVTDTATQTCPVLFTARIAITKNCPTNPVPTGELLTYTGTISNPGNITLLNVTVVDNQPTNNTPVLGPITLAPGASSNFTGSYLVPDDCCETVDTVTASGRDLCSGILVSSTATTVCPLQAAPRLTVTRVCPTEPVSVGSLFTYSGVVINTGNVTLTNVTVVGSQPTNNTLLLGTIELAPGESVEFLGSYIVSATAPSPLTDTVTARGTDTCLRTTIVTAIANCAGPITTPQPTIDSIAHSGRSVTVRWRAVARVTYCLQYKSDSSQADWVDCVGEVTAVGDTATKTDTLSSDTHRFYRIKVLSLH